MQLFKQGAEAHIYLEDNILIKKRITKSYRIEAIDLKLRRLRTRREAKLLQKAGEFVPKVFAVDDKQMFISMEYIKGDLLKDILDALPEKKRKLLLIQLGIHIATLHTKDIIHGDLTTSNIIILKNKPYLIDFGLGFVSPKLEDKAVDLHLLKQALTSKHYATSEEDFASILIGYKTYKDYEDVLKRLQKVEARGRYKQK